MQASSSSRPCHHRQAATQPIVASNRPPVGIPSAAQIPSRLDHSPCGYAWTLHVWLSWGCVTVTVVVSCVSWGVMKDVSRVIGEVDGETVAVMMAGESEDDGGETGEKKETMATVVVVAFPLVDSFATAVVFAGRGVETPDEDVVEVVLAGAAIVDTTAVVGVWVFSTTVGGRSCRVIVNVAVLWCIGWMKIVFSVDVGTTTGSASKIWTVWVEDDSRSFGWASARATLAAFPGEDGAANAMPASSVPTAARIVLARMVGQIGRSWWMGWQNLVRIVFGEAMNPGR